MADVERIYQLPAGTAVTDTSTFPDEDPGNSNITEKFTALQLATYMATKISTGFTDVLLIAANGNDSNPGTFSKPLLTLAGANTIVTANPGTQYIINDYRIAATETTIVFQPNAYYFASNTVLSFTNIGYGSHWGTTNQACLINGYVFNTATSHTFDASSFSVTHTYKLEFINCGGVGGGTFIFKGAILDQSGSIQQPVVKLTNFDSIGLNSTLTPQFNIGFQEGIVGLLQDGAIGDITQSMSVNTETGSILICVNTQIVGVLTLTATSTSGDGFGITVNIYGNVLNNVPVINANQTAGYFVSLGMDADAFRFDFSVSGTGSYQVFPLSAQGGIINQADSASYIGGSTIGTPAQDIPSAGAFGFPYATVGYALSQQFPDTNSANPKIIKFLGNVIETGTCLIQPNCVIDLNGYTWTTLGVGIDSSWTVDNGYQNCQTIIKNGFHVNSGTWDVLFTDPTLNADIILDRINVGLLFASPITSNYKFDFQPSHHLEVLNCQFGDAINNGDDISNGITFTFPSSGSIYFEGGQAPHTINAFGPAVHTGADPTTSVLQFNGIALNGRVYTDQWTVEINNVSFQDAVKFYLLNTTPAYYDTTVLYPQNTFINCLVVTGTTRTANGSGYTHATATFSAPSAPNGLAATGTVVLSGSSVSSITLTSTGRGYLKTDVVTVTITGDGTLGTFSVQMGSPNNLIAQVTDTAIEGTYTALNFAVPSPPFVGLEPTLYDYYHGLDNKFGNLTAYGVICGGTSRTTPQQSAGTGTSGQVLTSAGSSSLPTWQTFSTLTPAIGYLQGFPLSYNSGTVLNITSSIVSQATLYVNNSVTSPFTVTGAGTTLTVNFATTGAGGLDTGTVATNQRYYIFLVADSTGVNPLSAVASLVSGGITMPTGYNRQRCIGSWKTKMASSALVKFIQSGYDNERTYYCVDSPTEYNIISGGNATTSTPVSLGKLISIFAQDLILQTLYTPTIAGNGYAITNHGNTASAPFANSAQGVTAFGDQGQLGINVGDTSIDYLVTSGTTISIWVYGIKEFL